MRLADRALYAAKQNGRDRVEATSSAGFGLRRREAAEALVAETAAAPTRQSGTPGRGEPSSHARPSA